MTQQYPYCKTVRYSDDTWQRVVIAAGMLGVTTAEYIRVVVQNATARIDPEQVLPSEVEG